ncbi:MAG: efflux transporter outer membrane subunit [Paraburkholderia sp.]|uniref:efflux transporter outer membrane subunit n=1 Tax=Paraburkholderia sp. TaxID=1926495 RepID=UPI003C51C55B
MRSSVFALLLACPFFLTLNGCVLGPDYVRPTISTPATFRFATSDMSGVANTEWWRQFNDPELDRLIATALAQNKDVQIAGTRVDEFLGQFASTRSQLFPQLSAGLAAQRQRVPQAGGIPLLGGEGPDYSQLQATLGATWDIDLFGRVRRETEAARANVRASEEMRRATILTLVASVASSYINLRSLDQQLAIARDTTASRAESVRVFDLRFHGGEVSQMELAQSQSEYEASRATISRIEDQIAQQEDALAVLLGENPGAIPRGLRLPDLDAPAVPAGLPSDLIERRPDLRAAEQNLVAANALIGAAHALYFPSISLTGLFGSASGQLSKLFIGPARVWSFAGAVAQPVFTAGNIRGQVQQAQAQQQEALLQYQKAVQVAFQQVNDALISVQKLREQTDVQARQVKTLETYARLARLRYDGGYTSYLEVLDAERSLFNARLSYTQTRQAALVSFVNLYQSMGGGWAVDVEYMTAVAVTPGP